MDPADWVHVVQQLRAQGSVPYFEAILRRRSGEHGTALAQFSQRVALRQALQAATQLETELPRRQIRPVARRYDVPTRVPERSGPLLVAGAVFPSAKNVNFAVASSRGAAPKAETPCTQER